MKKLITTALFLVTLQGCDSGSPQALDGSQSSGSQPTTGTKIANDPVIEGILGQPVTQSTFIAANKLNNLPASRQAGAFNSFTERYRVAEYVLSHELASNADLHIEVAAKVSSFVLEAYLDRFVTDKVTDHSVEAYYEAHPNEFIEKGFRVTVLKISQPMGDAPGSTLSDDALNAYLNQDGQQADDSVYTVEEKLLDRTTAPPALLNQLANLTVGTWSDPEATRRKTTYYRLEEIKETPLPLDSVRKELRYVLEQQARQEEYRRLKKAANT